MDLPFEAVSEAGSCLQGLNPRQTEAAELLHGPLLIIAGAGTGKTRTLTARIARLIASGVAPWRILALTFTNKAAGEMRRRVDALVPGRSSQVWIHTFHSLGARLLRRHAEALGLKQDFLIYDDDDQRRILQSILCENGQDKEKSKAGLYVNIISRAKDDLLDAQSYAIHAQAAPTQARIPVAEVYEKYQRRLDQSGALDFGDLLLKTVGMLRDKQEIREHYQEQFLHVLVDEYQDTNHAQYMLTKTLTAKHRNVCVVGDPDQSIYSWRGADIRNILEFERDFPDAKVVPLEQNYRSTPEILSAAEKLIGHNLKRKPKNLFTDKPSGRPVIVEELPTESDEARWCARQLERICSEEQRNFGDFAVFYRTNAQSRSFEEACRREKIPYKIIGAVRFYDRKEIRDALAYARLLVNPFDAISLERILNVPARGIGKAAAEKFAAYATERGLPLYAALRDNPNVPDISSAARRGMKDLAGLIENLHASALTVGPAELLQKAILMSGYWQSIEVNAQKDPEEKDRLDNLQELINGVREYEERSAKAGASATLSGYLQEVALISGLDEFGEGVPSVTLMTVHLAKGLEFPVVFLTGLEEGLFPITAGSTEPDELEEERRLCYVGMTRARERLFMTCAATRRMFGKTYSNIFSRFLYESGLVKAPEQQPVSPRLFNTPSERGGIGSAAAPESPRDSNDMEGRRVRHAVYGEGRVILSTGSGENAKITVLFRQGGKQTFMLRYAPIEML